MSKTPEFRIFRSAIIKYLYSVNIVDDDENSVAVMQDFLNFDQAQGVLADYRKLHSIVVLEEITEKVAQV